MKNEDGGEKMQGGNKQYKFKFPDEDDDVGRGTGTGQRCRRGRWVHGPRRLGSDLLALASSGPHRLDPRDRSPSFNPQQILLTLLLIKPLFHFPTT